MLLLLLHVLHVDRAHRRLHHVLVLLLLRLAHVRHHRRLLAYGRLLGGGRRRRRRHGGRGDGALGSVAAVLRPAAAVIAVVAVHAFALAGPLRHQAGPVRRQRLQVFFLGRLGLFLVHLRTQRKLNLILSRDIVFPGDKTVTNATGARDTSVPRT